MMHLLEQGHGGQANWNEGIEQTWEAVQVGEDGTLQLGDLVRDHHRHRRRVTDSSLAVRRGMVGTFGIRLKKKRRKKKRQRKRTNLTNLCLSLQVRHVYLALDVSRVMADNDLRCPLHSPL